MKPFLVHVHVYYDFLFRELSECLKSLGSHPYDLFVTLVKQDEKLISEIKADFPDCKIEVLENLGFDLGPFVHVLNSVNLDDYSYVIKLHTKRDIPTRESFAWFAGARWRNALLKFVRTPEMFEKVLKRFEENPSIGMHGPNISTFNKLTDDHIAYRITNEFITSHGYPLMRYKFVAGTMFMVRAALLRKIVDLRLSQKDFEVPDESHEGCQYG